MGLSLSVPGFLSFQKHDRLKPVLLKNYARR